MKHLLIFITLFFFANLEFAFAGQISPASHLKPKVEIAPQSTLPLSPSPKKGLRQKINGNSKDIMLIAGAFSIFTLLITVGFPLLGLSLFAVPFGFIFGILCSIFGILGIKKAKQELNPKKAWGITAVTLGLLSVLLVLPVIIVVGTVLILHLVV